MGQPAACLFSPPTPPQHMLSTVGLVPRALFAGGTGGPIQPSPISTNRPPNLQACRLLKEAALFRRSEERKGDKAVGGGGGGEGEGEGEIQIPETP